MRVVVLGGAGNFGARVVRALRGDSDIDLLSVGRRGIAVPGAQEVAVVALDIEARDFTDQLRALAPGLVINCTGPFQGQDYRVAQAALAAGAHYIDLADGRRFVTEFAKQVHEHAVAAGRVAITGASTLPALSSAVIERLREGLSSLDSIDIVIAPGQRAPRGRATLEAVFSYLGRTFPVWRDGAWAQTYGWMDLRTARLDIGSRFSAACDVPDLELFPTHFADVQSVRFHAALEFRLQHFALWALAGLRRIGLPFPVTRWAIGLNRFSGVFDGFAGPLGGMSVSIIGAQHDGRRIRRTWNLKAPATHGPEIPCMATILLARHLARGRAPTSGAFPCMGFLALPEFDPEFAKWGITTRVAEEPA